MSCTTTPREAGGETADGQASSPVTAEPIERIEHGLDAALEQMEAVAVVIAESAGEVSGVVPLEQMALEARVGALRAELQAVRESLGTLVIRRLVPSPA